MLSRYLIKIQMSRVEDQKFDGYFRFTSLQSSNFKIIKTNKLIVQNYYKIKNFCCHILDYLMYAKCNISHLGLVPVI